MSYKILLIKPNICVRKNFDLQSKMAPPVGLAYLAASLIKEGYEVKILDMVAASKKSWAYNDTHNCFGQDDSDLITTIKEYQPNLVGIGGFTSQFPIIKRITRLIKKYDNKIKIVLGGVNATAMPEFVLKNTHADFVIQGESEYQIVELAEGLYHDNFNKIKNIDGIAYKDFKNVIVMPRKNFENDLDSIPWPARELFNHDDYIKDNVAMPVLTSRSCPGNCAFCSIHILSGKKYRQRDPYKVVDEIDYMVSKWGYKTVSIFDDACNVNPERLIKICQEVISRKLDVRLVFPGGLIINYITKDLLYWMKKAGTISLALPVEHINDNIRNNIIRKNLKIEKIIQVLNWCKELKLLALVNFVIGMPGESEKTLQEIINFVKENSYRIASIAVYIATPFPGTRFYDICIEKGYLINNENEFLDYDLYTAHIDTDVIKNDNILKYKKIIEKTFAEIKEKDLDISYIRKAIRKPDKDTMDYIENVYFK